MENDTKIVYAALKGAQALIEDGYSPYQIETAYCFDTREAAFASLKEDQDNLKIVCSLQIPSNELYPDKSMPQAIGKCTLCVDDILQVYTLCTMSLTGRESLVNTTRLTPAQYRELLRMTREEPSADLGSIVAKASLQAIYSNINPLTRDYSESVSK